LARQVSLRALGRLLHATATIFNIHDFLPGCNNTLTVFTSKPSINLHNEYEQVPLLAINIKAANTNLIDAIAIGGSGVNSNWRADKKSRS